MIFSTQEPHCTIPDDLKCIYIKCVVLNTRLTKDIKNKRKLIGMLTATCGRTEYAVVVNGSFDKENVHCFKRCVIKILLSLTRRRQTTHRDVDGSL